MKMNFLEKIKNRYTVKRYDKNGTIGKDTLEQLKEILRLSPSSNNSQPWRFVFVRDKEAKEKFAKASHPGNDQRIMDCSCLVIFQRIDNLELYEKRITEQLPEHFVNDYINHIKPQGEGCIKSWFSNQVYITLGILLSACADMEIGSTPMEGIDVEQYDKILDNPDFKTLFAVAIGMADKNDKYHPSKKSKARLGSTYTTVEV